MENHAACKKNLWDKISFQLLNERSVSSNFNIIHYEKQSASFNHQLNAEICCLCVVKCVVGGPNHPNPRWRRPTIRLPELCTLPFGVFFGQHISHQFLQQTFFSAHIFNILFILTLVATKYFFQFYSSPPRYQMVRPLPASLTRLQL